MQLLTIVAMIFAVGGVMFALQNNESVAVTFLVWHFNSSLAMVLLLALALGGLIVGLVSTPSTLRRQWAIARLEKQVAELGDQCDTQKETIADLCRRIPAAVPEPDPDKTRPYVGLKQLVTGGAKVESPPSS